MHTILMQPIPTADVKSRKVFTDVTDVSQDTAASLDFETTAPFGDATFLGYATNARKTYDTPHPVNDRVVALSLRGVRVDHQGDASFSAGERLTITLIHEQTRLKLPVRVAHVAGREFRRFTFSLVFEGLTDSQREGLVRLMAVDYRRLLVA